jgi:hypothetical protein
MWVGTHLILVSVFAFCHALAIISSSLPSLDKAQAPTIIMAINSNELMTKNYGKKKEKIEARKKDENGRTKCD